MSLSSDYFKEWKTRNWTACRALQGLDPRNTNFEGTPLPIHRLASLSSGYFEEWKRPNLDRL
eukprot:8045186-Karenia_brevis.AAC.1